MMCKRILVLHSQHARRRLFEGRFLEVLLALLNDSIIVLATTNDEDGMIYGDLVFLSQAYT